MSVSRNPNLGVITSINVPAETWRRNLGRSNVFLGAQRSSQWWTGLPPSQCPGLSADGKLHSLVMPNLATCTRQEVSDYFDNTWTLSELLFSSLIGEEAFYRPPYHALRHPLIFYYVHPVVLYVNKLRLSGLCHAAINPYFESLFETGVDEMSWDDMSKNDIEWPSIDDALSYRRQVYSAVKSIIESHPDLSDGHAPITQNHPLWALFMGFEHERIHLETSSVLIREMPVHMVTRPDAFPPLAQQKPAAFPPHPGANFPTNQLVDVQAQTVSYGKPNEWPTFGWDNEYGSRSFQMDGFQTSRFLISNGEFWQFVSDSGYHDETNWSETGWRWRCFRNVKCPTFWIPDGPDGSHQYRLRTCFEIIDMQWDWPCVVNFHEAKAFCAWKSRKDNKSYRLLTEAEHQALRQTNNFRNDNNDVLIAPTPFNTNLRHGSECAVSNCALSNDNGVCDLFGNVWQWCEDHFNPLEGSQVHPLYEDFSVPCYDGQHQMIMGGSFISTGDEASPWARFHFRPHFFQHAGFRVVHSDAGNDGRAATIRGTTQADNNPYETEEIFNEYMTLHYGSPELQMPFAEGPRQACEFPQRCADLVIEWCKRLSISTRHALDLGCAVGGATFRLSEAFDHVVGIDLSERFINAARVLQQHHKLTYYSKVEGELTVQQKATVDSTSSSKAEFVRGNACALPPEYSDFDAVLMANLLCRLPEPQSCLKAMWENRAVVRPGGLLVIVSPYTWMEKFTPRENWLGGFNDQSGNARLSEDGLKSILSAHFNLLEVRDMPLVIREHNRKYQYIVSQAMVWRRHS